MFNSSVPSVLAYKRRLVQRALPVQRKQRHLSKWIKRLQTPERRQQVLGTTNCFLIHSSG